MSASLRVGMRVRIVGCDRDSMKHLMGKEGVITDHCPCPCGGFGVSVVGFGTCDAYGMTCTWAPHHLAPILPDTYKVIPWSQCKEWQPEHERDGVAA